MNVDVAAKGTRGDYRNLDGIKEVRKMGENVKKPRI